MRVTYHYEVLVCPREAYLITQSAQPSPADATLMRVIYHYEVLVSQRSLSDHTVCTALLMFITKK